MTQMVVLITIIAVIIVLDLVYWFYATKQREIYFVTFMVYIERKETENSSVYILERTFREPMYNNMSEIISNIEKTIGNYEVCKVTADNCKNIHSLVNMLNDKNLCIKELGLQKRSIVSVYFKEKIENTNMEENV